MKKLWSTQLFIFTVLWILVNYIAYYADDLMVVYGMPTTSLWIEAMQALAFPVTWYVEIIEPYTLLPIPILGRAINYCVELAYFYSVLFCLVTAVEWLDNHLVKKIQTFFN